MTAAKFFENDEKEGYYEDEEEEIRTPRKPGDAPDGGWGWLVVLGAFLCNLLVEGLILSYGIIKYEVEEYFETPQTSVLLAGVFMEAFSLIIGPFAGALVTKYGSRKVTIAGSLMVCVGLLVSTKMPDLAALKVTYGVVAGIGLGLVYLSSIVTVAVWFEYKRSFATGVAVMGAGVGYFIFPSIYKSLLETNDWKNATVIVAAVSLNCAVGGAFFRPLTHAKPKGMKRGIIQHGAIMKALIAEKERQRTISNGSLDNCIITKDNRLIKLDKIDLRNKSSSYINRLKETFGFSSRSLNRSKNSLIVPKVVVDPIYKARTSPKPRHKIMEPKPVSTPPTPKRDSGCGGSLDSPNFRSRSYEALPHEEPWGDRLVVNLPSSPTNEAKVTNSDRTLNNLDAPKRRAEEKVDPSFLSANVSPVGSGRNISMRLVSGSMQSGAKNVVLPVQSRTSVMTVPSCHSVEMSTIYEEERTDCKLCRKICKLFNLVLLKSPTFLLLLICSVFTMLGYVIPYANLPRKALSVGVGKDDAMFLISILWVVNMIGRFVFGWVADRPWASPIQLNNLLVGLAGVLSFFSTAFMDQGLLSFYAAFFGLFTAAFMTLRSIMLIELFGKETITSSFGLLCFFQGLAMLAGYEFADFLHGDIAFHIAGGLLLSAGILGFFLPRVKYWEDNRNAMMKIVDIEEIPVGGPPEDTLRVESCESTI